MYKPSVTGPIGVAHARWISIGGVVSKGFATFTNDTSISSENFYALR
jgi:hypothetical protein